MHHMDLFYHTLQFVQVVDKTFCLLGYERVYLIEVADTPFQIQGDDLIRKINVILFYSNIYII